MADLEFTTWTTLVKATVRDVTRKYGEWVDEDDLMQEAALWWYGPGQPYLHEYLTNDPKFVRIRRSIWRWCARYAEQEKASRRGYKPQDQVRYSPLEILRILPLAMDPDGIPDGGGVLEGPRPKGNLAEGGDMLASLVDVRRALHALTEDDQHFLTLADDLRHDWERVATYTETLPDSARRRHARIAERMARWLNDDDKDTDHAAA